MNKILYDLLYIIDPTIDESEQKKIEKEVREIILQNSGEIIKESTWGKLNMTYPIAKRTEGIYINIEFKATREVPKQLEIYDHTHPGLLRHLILRVPKAKLVQEKRDADRRRRDLEAAEKARRAALAAEAKAELEAAIAQNPTPAVEPASVVEPVQEPAVPNKPEAE